MHKWFYLLATGFQGSAYNDLGYGYSNLQGIGVEKAIQIVWNAIPALNANSDYPAFKTATLNAAAQLYGQNSSEYLATKKRLVRRRRL
jgi:Zn-dependent metalloprotease